MYRHLTTQEEIDREYNPRLIVTDVDTIVKGWKDRSAATRARTGTGDRLRRAYGATLAEYLDIFPAGTPTRRSTSSSMGATGALSAPMISASSPIPDW